MHARARARVHPPKRRQQHARTHALQTEMIPFNYNACANVRVLEVCVCAQVLHVHAGPFNGSAGRGGEVDAYTSSHPRRRPATSAKPSDGAAPWRAGDLCYWLVFICILMSYVGRAVRVQATRPRERTHVCAYVGLRACHYTFVYLLCSTRRIRTHSHAQICLCTGRIGRGNYTVVVARRGCVTYCASALACVCVCSV